VFLGRISSDLVFVTVRTRSGVFLDRRTQWTRRDENVVAAAFDGLSLLIVTVHVPRSAVTDASASPAWNRRSNYLILCTGYSLCAQEKKCLVLGPEGTPCLWLAEAVETSGMVGPTGDR
jgi:hypothetical protein